MKKTLKTAAAVLAAVTAMSCTGLSAYADKLRTVDGVTYRYSDSGEQKGKYTGWSKTSKGKRYYKKGVMYTNKWLKTKNGKYYYAGSDGYMRTGWAKVTRGKGNFSFFDKNGVWDGKTYYTGYQPSDLHAFFLDYDFFTDSELTIGYTKSGTAVKTPESFNDADTLYSILEKDLYTITVKDKSSGDEIELSSEIFHEGRCIKINSSADSHAYLEFTSDGDGNSYLYNGYFGFGLKLKDKHAFAKLSEIIDGGEDVEEGLEDDEEEDADKIGIGAVKSAVEKNIPSDIYGGIYEMAGKIVVLSTDVNTAKKTIKKLYPDASDIEVRKCDFSLEYLTRVKSELYAKRQELGISGISTDILNNRVVVEGAVLTNKLKEYVRKLGYEPCVQYLLITNDDVDD